MGLSASLRREIVGLAEVEVGFQLSLIVMRTRESWRERRKASS